MEFTIAEAQSEALLGTIGRRQNDIIILTFRIEKGIE